MVNTRVRLRPEDARRIVTRAIQIMHKHIVDEFTVTVAQIREAGEDFEIQGKLHMYSGGLFHYTAVIGKDLQVKSVDEKFLYNF